MSDLVDNSRDKTGGGNGRADTSLALRYDLKSTNQLFSVYTQIHSYQSIFSEQTVKYSHWFLSKGICTPLTSSWREWIMIIGILMFMKYDWLEITCFFIQL